MPLSDEPNYPNIAEFDGSPARSMYEKWATFLQGVFDRMANAIHDKVKLAVQEASLLDTATATATTVRADLAREVVAANRVQADAAAATQVLTDKIAEAYVEADEWYRQFKAREDTPGSGA